MLDKDGKGILEDIVHARVFYSAAFADGDAVSKILADLDTVPAVKDLKYLHGPSFFTRAGLDDLLADLVDAMDKVGAVVGIVVDDKGKPTYCQRPHDSRYPWSWSNAVQQGAALASYGSAHADPREPGSTGRSAYSFKRLPAAAGQTDEVRSGPRPLAQQGKARRPRPTTLGASAFLGRRGSRCANAVS